MSAAKKHPRTVLPLYDGPALPGPTMAPCPWSGDRDRTPDLQDPPRRSPGSGKDGDRDRTPETPALPGDAESIETALAEHARGDTISTAELMRLLDEDAAQPIYLPVDTSAARYCTVRAFDVFADGSGVSALLECGRYRFACSWTGARTFVVHPVQSRDGNRRIPAKHLRCAQADFGALLDANLDEAYRAKCAALYTPPSSDDRAL